jgi:hypothetical protein
LLLQDEHWNDESTEERRKSIDFIEREFSSERSQKVRWRFCVHHMTSAKLSAGDDSRDNMALSGITDACRRHGALIISGHHHIYSRTKLLHGVGGPQGDEEILVANPNNSIQRRNAIATNVVSEGTTMSITVGMGGYDSSCNGKYWNASWMEICVASLENHRGAVIAEFDAETPWTGTFRYMNSLANAEIVDEFVLRSRLPGWNTTFAPTASPTMEPTETPTSPVTSTSPSAISTAVQPSKSPMSSDHTGIEPIGTNFDEVELGETVALSNANRGRRSKFTSIVVVGLLVLVLKT